jgi:hypothetical protein
MSTSETGESFPSPCPECQSMRVVAATDAGTLTIPPLYPREPASAYGSICSLFAVVCIRCGHTTLFASNTQKVRLALEKNPRNFQGAALTLRIQQRRR